MIPIKTAADIRLMEEAGRISAGALAAAGAAVHPGATTADIDKAVYDYIIGEGAKPNFKDYNGFPASACVSLNDQVIHGIPSPAVTLKEGDIVSIDTGAVYKGLHGDNAFTFPVGEISAEAKRLLSTTRKALFAGIEAAQAGNRVGDIGWAVQSIVETAGYSVVRAFVGHGLGHSLHESPEVPNFGKPGHGPRLVPGMTIAIEPMVNQKGFGISIAEDGWTVTTADGSLSAHFEHTVLITEAGPRILTWEKALWS